MRRRSLLLLFAPFVLLACGGADDPATATPPAATATTAAASCPPAGRRQVDGGTLVVPRGAAPGATPLLVVTVPGGGGDPRDGLGLAAAARRTGLALLYPTSKGDGFWTLNREQGDQDVTNVRALIERELATGCFDRARVTATGVSNGAGFATRLACELPETFAGVVPVSAGFRALDPCPKTARTSLLALHGSADTIVPYNGKKPGREGSVPRFAARWAQRLGCDAPPRTTTPRPRVTRITYRGCPDGLRVGIVRLRGSTHGWFGAPRSPFPQTNPSGYQATPEVVRFALAVRRG